MRGTDIGRTGITDHIGEHSALKPHVYKDENGRPWFQMSAGSTIYHYGGRPFWAPVDALYVQAKGQKNTPVIKLVSADNTGGSCEIILTNQNAKSIGAVGKKTWIRDLVVTRGDHQGSYNYSETIKQGLVAHDRRDVKPHLNQAGFYVDPEDRFSSLALRHFPEKDPLDPRGRPLAQQMS